MAGSHWSRCLGRLQKLWEIEFGWKKYIMEAEYRKVLTWLLPALLPAPFLLNMNIVLQPHSPTFTVFLSNTFVKQT